jgi:3-oxoacyl-[acyl-carrier protein] reductase
MKRAPSHVESYLTRLDQRGYSDGMAGGAQRQGLAAHISSASDENRQAHLVSSADAVLVMTTRDPSDKTLLAQTTTGQLLSSGSGKLTGRVAIVTGASRGIGSAIARRLGQEGAKVVVNYNASSKQAEETQREIAEKGGESITFKGDVSNSREVKAMVEATMARFGRVDILVNNAGIIFRKKILESTEEDWDRTMDVNLKSVYLCSRAVAPIMIQQKRGKIVNISSISGLDGPASALEIPDYTASKAGVIGLTRTLALNLAPFINVNVVCPGAVETDMLGAMSEEGRRSRIVETPLKRFGRPDEIAAAVLFLASDDSDFVTGETLVVSGGRPVT